MAKVRRKIERLGEEERPLPDFAVQLKGVSFTYEEGQPNAVNNVSLDINRGEFVTVIGHNGSGKSTLARLICGLLSADAGKVTTWGYDPSFRAELAKVRMHAGIVFQNPDNQTVASIVEDDVAFGPENLGLDREEIGRRIDWALEAVGMQSFRRATPNRLSGGQKQRLAVAGVLAIKPDVLILDESTAMLDPKGRREVTQVAARLNREEGMTVILITHFLEEALLAHRAVIMNKGEIVAQGAPREIFEKGELLETYNLCLPRVPSICRSLSAAGIPIKNCLLPEELSKELTALALKGFKPLPENIEEEGEKEKGEWDIDISDLTYTYSPKTPFASRALNGVSLHISEGEFFGIIGHTGSGKSTLVQHLNALIRLPQTLKHYKKPKAKKGAIPPPQPNIKIGGYDLTNKKTNWRNLRADVGMVFQYPEYQLFAETVFADVAFGLKNFRPDSSPEETEQAVKESIEAVGLNYEEVKDKSPFDLSGGQKRRVAIAGVIVTKPKILILDEPAAGLDPLGKRDITALLHSLHKDWCKTVIIVSHDMDEIAENCTKACVISNGAVLACAAPERLFEREEELLSLGLDVPTVSKIKNDLTRNGIKVVSDCTSKGLTAALIAGLKGVGAND